MKNILSFILIVLFQVLIFSQPKLVENQKFKIVQKWFDGSAMDNTKVDSIIYIKKYGKYYKRILDTNKGYDVKIFGAKGDAKNDDTQFINKAIKICSNIKSPINITEGEYKINCDTLYTGVIAANDMVLNFSDNAVFKALINKTGFYSILRIYNVQNIIVNNPRVVGDRKEHIIKKGEWGYGIYIENSQNVNINNAKVVDCWGDGIYIGNKMYDNTQRFSTNNISITNPIVDNCRRNGIAICMGQNITIKNAIIKNINGTSPQAGIDIEPEWDRGILPILFNDIKIINPYTENCSGDGIQIFLNFLGGKDVETNIDLINHKDLGSNTGVTFYKTFGKIKGRINIIAPNWTNNKTHGIKMIDYTYNGPPIVTITNPKIINWNRNFASSSRENSAILLVSEERFSNKIGNVIIVRPSFVIEDGFTNDNSIFNIQNATKGLGNLELQDVVKIENAENFITSEEGLIISDKNKKLSLKKK